MIRWYSLAKPTANQTRRRQPKIYLAIWYPQRRLQPRICLSGSDFDPSECKSLGNLTDRHKQQTAARETCLCYYISKRFSEHHYKCFLFF